MSIKYKFSEKIYSIREARANFSALVQESYDFGKPIIIAKYGKPIAQIVATSTHTKQNKSSKIKYSGKPRFLQVKGQRVLSLPISDNLQKIQALSKGKQFSTTKSDKELREEYLVEKYTSA